MKSSLKIENFYSTSMMRKVWTYSDAKNKKHQSRDRMCLGEKYKGISICNNR